MVKLGREVSDITNVGIADRMRQRERTLRSGDLDDGRDVHVSVHNELSALVPVGVHLRVRGSSTGNTGDDICGKRLRRLMVSQ